MTTKTKPTSLGLLVSLVDEVTPVLGEVERLLEQWTGEHSATCPGASAPTSTGLVVPADDVRLLKVEADAARPDPATRTLRRLRRDVARALVEARQASPVEFPPVSVRSGSASVLVRRWAMVALLVGQLDESTPSRDVERLVRVARPVADVCRTWRPPKVEQQLDVCRSHEAAGRFEAIDDRYRAKQLCRWCGDFLAGHGALPFPGLVRMHDRGIKITPSLVANERARMIARGERVGRRKTPRGG